MKVVVQRVSMAKVEVNNTVVGKIDNGFLLLLGVGESDTIDDIDWLVRKLSGMRIFNDDDGKMNKSIVDVNGSFLCISQFTLYASTKKGNRPSFINAAKPDLAIPLYEQFCSRLSEFSKLSVETGIFGADMKVTLINDGPVTIIIDSKDKK